MNWNTKSETALKIRKEKNTRFRPFKKRQGVLIYKLKNLQTQQTNNIGIK